MKFGVVVFPGSNCDHDALWAVSQNLGAEAEFIWHDSHKLPAVDAVILPGGFSYGDYLRCGAIAKFSPVMTAVKKFAADGGLVAGICNGFQILTESGMLPGALVRNQGLKFVCRPVELEIVSTNTPFTNAAEKGTHVTFPVAHGEGCYIADEHTLEQFSSAEKNQFYFLVFHRFLQLQQVLQYALDQLLQQSQLSFPFVESLP